MGGVTERDGVDVDVAGVVPARVGVGLVAD